MAGWFDHAAAILVGRTTAPASEGGFGQRDAVVDALGMLDVLIVLSRWAESGFEQEVGPIRRGSGLVPITLAHNLPTRQQVDVVLAEARAAGAREVADAVEREWGGYTGYFADPDGFRWEIAWNPGPIGLTVL